MTMPDHPSLAVVVPVRGKSDAILAASLSSLAVAVSQCPGAILVLVDNNPISAGGPTLAEFARGAVIVPSAADTVGGVRNDGVRALPASVSLIAFVDCDCVARPSFCLDLVELFSSSTAEIIGCRVVSPIDGHWTETASDALHRQNGDGPRDSLNSGCLAIRADAFHAVGGFSEILPSNEDYDLCRRVRLGGGTVWQFERLQVTHLGNPKDVSAFMRRLIWHGRGAVKADGTIDFSAMLLATLANTLALVLGAGTSVLLGAAGRWGWVTTALAFALCAVPTAFWLLRMRQLRRWISPIPSIALMQLTFIARQVGLLRRLAELRSPSPS